MSESHAAPARVPGFSVDVRPERDHVAVVPHGELDIVTVARVEEEVLGLYDRGVAAVVLDLRALSFMDSSGLRLLVRLDDAATARGRRFSIADGQGPAHRLLALTHLHARFSAPA